MSDEQDSIPASENSKTILWVLIMVIFIGGFIFVISRNVDKNQITKDNPATPATKNSREAFSLEGAWVGNAYQDDIKQSFDIKLTCNKGKYTIEYPSIGCGGEWRPTESSSDKIVFEEQLSYGQDICNNGGTVVVTFEGKDQLKFQYYFPNLDTLNAVGVLHRDQ